MTQKTAAKIALVVSALFFPFWITAAIFVVASIFFDRFYFGLVVMFCLDLLYGFETISVFGIHGALFFGSLVVFLLIQISHSFMNMR